MSEDAKGLVSTSPSPTGSEADAHTLASSLAPVLQEACGGRLSKIRWFRADWQRGGAATGKAELVDENGQPHKVVVKIPVGNTELCWTRRLQTDSNENPIVPRLYASGDMLEGYDLAWLVMECLPYGPLGVHWTDDCIPRIAEAAAKFYKASQLFKCDRKPVSEEWHELISGSRVNIQENAIENAQRWTTAVKTLQSKLDQLVTEWRSRPINSWLHGDLHPANAMCRSNEDGAGVTLIDLAEIRPGNWVEDAVYLERLLWARPDSMKKYKPVKEIAKTRKAESLEVGSDYQRLATIRRVLLAATAPRFLKSEGSPPYLAACLDKLESALTDLK